MSYPSALANCAAEPTVQPVSTRRLLLLACDDQPACAAWRQHMASEPLQFAEPGDARAGGTAPAEALVLFMARSLTEQLGRLRELRTQHPGIPLLVVGHGLRELDQVLALEMGADDVLDAALGAPVVAAKLRVLWRRLASAAPQAEAPESLRFGALQLLHRQRQVLRDSSPLDLTEGEFELLWILALHAGQTVLRADLLRQLRGLRDAGADRSIDCRVYRIRAKLGEPAGNAGRIRTIRNRGYLFSPEPS